MGKDICDTSDLPKTHDFLQYMLVVIVDCHPFHDKRVFVLEVPDTLTDDILQRPE
jgi:hypothetical protein